MSRGDMESRVRERIASWNRHDVAGFVGYYSDDATVYDPMYPEPLRGAAAVRRDFQEFITAFPDTEFVLGTVVDGGDTVAFEVTARGTHTGPLAGPAGVIAPTGRSIVMPIGSFDRLDDDRRVTEERRYYDVAGLLPQLGITG